MVISLCTANGFLLAHSTLPSDNGIATGLEETPSKQSVPVTEAIKIDSTDAKVYASISASLWSSVERGLTKGFPGVDASRSKNSTEFPVTPLLSSSGGISSQDVPEDVKVVLIECEVSILIFMWSRERQLDHTLYLYL